MANIKVKRSAVPGKIPQVGDLQLGEFALNTYDGKLFAKKNVNGVESIVEFGETTAGVITFNTRSGAVTLNSSDVTGALGYTPYNSTNPNGYITSSALTPYITSATAASTYQPLDADLTSIAGLAGTSGLLKKTAANTWSLDTNVYLTGNQSISISGDATGSGTTAIALTLANSGVTAGTYTKVTVDAKGRATSGTTLSASDIPNLDASKITTGTLDAARLPSYVDDVLEYANLAGFPASGESGKIYVALDTNKTYRWSGSAYIYITSGAVDSVAGKTGVVTLTSSDVGLGNVENKSSATIRGELTSSNVTTALGYTPYNSSNPSGYITSSALSSYLPLSGGTLTGELYTPTLTAGGLGRSASHTIGANLGSGAISWNNAQLEIKNTDAGSVGLALHRAGYTSNSISVTDGNGIRIDGSIALHAGNYNSYALPLSGGTLTGALNWAASAGLGNGNARSLVTGYSGGNYGQTGYGISFTGTSGLHNYAINDIVSLWEAYDGLRVYAAAGGAVGSAITWTAVLDARRSNSALVFKGQTVLDAGNYNSYALPLSGGTLTGSLLTTTAASSWGVYSNTNGSNFSGIWFSSNVGELLLRKADGSLSTRIAADGSHAFINGNNILHAGNYSSYALPLTGGTVTGRVVFTGSADSDSYAGVLRIAPSSSQHWGGISFPDTNAGSSNANNYWFLGRGTAISDRTLTAHIPTYADYGSTGAIPSWGVYTTGALNLFRVWSNGAVTAGGNQVLHAGNYSSYALPLSGGTVSGTVRINSQLQVGQNTNGTAFIDAYDGYAWFGRDSNSAGIRIDGSGNVHMTGTLNSASTLTQGGNQVLHAGNYSTYSPSYGYFDDYQRGAYRVIADYGSQNTWYIRSNGRFTWARAHDWSQSFDLDLGSGGTNANNGWARFGQQNSNSTAGTWFGTRFVQYTGGTSIDGFVRAGRYYLGDDTNYMYNAGDGSLRVQTANGYVDIGPKNSSWCHIYSDRPFYTNQGIWINNSRVLDAGNYTSYSPSLTGSGASGTWGISVTGNAATATRTSGVSGYAHAGTGMYPFFNWGGSGGGDSAPSDSTYTIGISVGSHPSDQAYGFQIARNMWATGLWTRGYDSSFGSWVRLLDSSNYSSYAPSLTGSGASGTWGISITGNAATAGGLAPAQFFNNMGNNHGTQTDFSNITNFGARYVQGSANGPGTGTQYYGFTLGLGNDYPYSDYASQLYWPRTPLSSNTPYLSVRFREGGSWGSWSKIWAGYADTAGSATDSTKLPLSGGTLTGELTLSGNNTWFGGSTYLRSNTAFSFLTNSGSAQNARFNGIQVSDSYAGSVPTNGILFGTDTTLVRDGAYQLSLSGNRVLHAGNSTSYPAASAPLLSAVGQYSFSASTNGRSFNDGIQAGFVSNGEGYPSYGSVVRVKTYPNDGGTAELYFPYSATYGGSAMRYRLGQYDNAGWTGWKTVLDDSNYSSYALPLSGGTLTGTINAPNFINSANSSYGIFGNNGYFDTVNGRGSDPLELNYYDGGPVKIGSGTNGSKSLYAVGIYDNGNQVLHAGNYTGYEGHLRANGYIAGTSADWNSIGNVNNTIYQVNAESFGNSNGPNQRSYSYGTLINFASLASSQAQIYISHAGNDLIFRGGWNGASWQTWNKVLTDQNYNSYSPSLTGSGASGTWGISITGNAATAYGLAVHTGRNNEANKVVRTDGSGYIQAGWINTTSGDNGTTAIDRVYASSDGYIRYYTPANFRQVLDVPTRTGGSASGTWGISVTGSSATTSAVSSTGYGSTQLTWRQESGTFAGQTGWASYLISSHGDGATYYNQTLIMPFWGAPQYSRLEGGTFKGPYTFLTTENYTSYSPSLTGSGASGTWGINVTGSAGSVAWTNVTSRPTALSSFTNDSGYITSSGSISGSAGSVSGLTLTSSANGINPDNVTQNQLGYNTSVSLFGQSDGGLYSSAYSSSWIHQIYGDFRTGQIAIRGKNSGTWQSWRTVLDSSNYSDYAVKINNWHGNLYHHTDGRIYSTIYYDANDSGYYVDPNGTSRFSYIRPNRISVVGSQDNGEPRWDFKAYVVESQHHYAQNSTQTMYLGESNPVIVGGDIRSPVFYDSNDTSYYVNPNGTSNLAGGTIAGNGYFDFGPNSSWGATLRVGGNGHGGGDRASVATTNGNLHLDAKSGSGIYLGYYTGGPIYATSLLYPVLHAGNYTSYALSLSGGTVEGVAYFQTNSGGLSGNTTSARLQAYSTGNNSAFMSFHKSGHYAINMGLDDDNVFRIGGWSASANRFQMDMSGNLTMAGNVTAYSDEGLKKDWAPVATDFVARLAGIKSGTYTRIDSGERQAGASAQDWQKLLPEVVNAGADGILSLAYGNAAMVSAVELAKRVVEQDLRIAKLEALVERLLAK